MSEQARGHLETMDWETLFSRTRTFIDRSARTRVAAGAIVLLSTTSMVTLISRHPAQTAWHAMVAGVVTLGIIWISSRMKLARAARQRDDVGELLFLYRSELERRLRATWRVAAIPVVIPLFFSAIHERLVSTQAWVGFIGMVCIMLAAMAHVVFIRRPRIQRELAALKADTRK